MAKGTEEQEQVMGVSKVPRRELRSMLRRRRLLDLNEWEPLGQCLILGLGTRELRLHDEELDDDVRADAERRLIHAARLFATEVVVTEAVYLVPHGNRPSGRSRNAATLLEQVVSSSGITRAFGGAIKVDLMTRNQIQWLMEEVTREAIYARFECSIILSVPGGYAVWSPCHHADVHVYTDGGRELVTMLLNLASAADLSISYGP